LELGKDEKWLLEQARKTRQPLPKQFLNAPELFAGLDIYYIAFMDLTSCRDIGQNVMGPISWYMVQQYCNEYGIEGEQREDVFYHVLKMDEAYIEYTLSKAKHDAASRKAIDDAKFTPSGGRRR
jgi:hypothetical protein